MAARKGIDRTVLSVAVIGSLVLLNVLSLRFFARLDLTRDQRFTLSEATQVTLEDLRDPVTVRAYFTSDLPPPFSTNTRYVRDLLEEYHSSSGGNVQFEFVDPVAEDTAEDKEKKKDVKRDIFGRTIRESTTVEQELQSLGIPPVQVQVNEDDKIEVKRAYMGIAVNYGDETEVVPMVQSTEGLEYDLTTLIRKLTREKTPKVAILGGHDGDQPRETLGQVRGLIGQLYEVVDLDLSTEGEIPEDVQAILVIGPTTPLSDDEKKKLDAFITSGKSVAFLLDAMKADFQTLTAKDADHGLSDLIASYGVKVTPGLIIDAESATINVGQQRGFMRIMQPVKYPLIPQPKSLSGDHPLTRGLSQVAFPFMSALEVAAPEGVAAEVLVKSSDKSWVQQPPYDLNPMQQWSAPASEAGPRAMVVALSGKLPSHYPAAAPEDQTAAGEGRVVVIGGSSFVDDQFLAPGNQALVLNLLDWLLLDDALLAVRTRGLDAAPLAELDDDQRAVVRYANVIGLPLLLIAFGVLRWRLRERRRALVHV